MAVGRGGGLWWWQGGQVKGDVDCLLGSVVLPAGDVRATWALLHEGVGELLMAFGLYEMAWWALGGGGVVWRPEAQPTERPQTSQAARMFLQRPCHPSVLGGREDSSSASQPALRQKA